MGVHRESYIEAVGFVERLAAPSAKRRWSDEAKGRIGAETLVAVVGTTGQADCAGNCRSRVLCAGGCGAVGRDAGHYVDRFDHRARD